MVVGSLSCFTLDTLDPVGTVDVSVLFFMDFNASVISLHSNDISL